MLRQVLIRRCVGAQKAQCASTHCGVGGEPISVP
jgi:hypothetical protein